VLLDFFSSPYYVVALEIKEKKIKRCRKRKQQFPVAFLFLASPLLGASCWGI
jgi:hypothetical protein